MKKIILTILIMLFSTSLFANHRENFYGIRYDYTLHFETGMVSAIVIDQWNKGMFGIEEDYGLLSIGIPICMGLFKEWGDLKSSNTSLNRETYNDLGFTVLGAISGKFLSYTF